MKRLLLSVFAVLGLAVATLAPAFALALGAAGHDAAEPLGTGLAKSWRGSIAFQALRGVSLKWRNTEALRRLAYIAEHRT